MEYKRGSFNGRGRGSRGARNNFRATSSGYFGTGTPGVKNSFVVHSSRTKQAFSNSFHSDRGKVPSRETFKTDENPYFETDKSVPGAANRDKELIDAAAKGQITNLSNILKTSLNHISRHGLDLALLEAAKRGNKLIIQHLLRSGARTIGQDEQGHTPLMIAAEKGFLDIADILLRKGANVNAVNYAGKTALMLALQPCGASALISLLLHYNSDVNIQCKQGCTPVIRAIELKDLDAIKLLIDAGANLDRLRNQNGETAFDVATRVDMSHVLSLMLEELQFGKKNHTKQTALMKAAASCNIDAFKLLLDCSYTNIDRVNKDGSTLMQIVRALCKQNHKDSANTAKRFEMIKLLLQNGAEADDCPMKEGNALFVAVKSGQNEVVQLLCHNRVKLNYLINDKTALMLAIEKGNIELVRILLGAGADWKVKNSRQEDALLIAFKYGQIDCAKILIQRLASFNTMKAAITAIENNRPSSLHYILTHHELNINSKYLLHRAIQQNSVPLVKLLIDKGADVNLPNECMDSPLFLACNKDVSCVELLIKNGADVNLGHPSSGPPLIRAVPKVARVLLKHGADVNKASASGETALMQACCGFGNTYDMVKLLLDAGANVSLTSEKGDTCLHYAVSSENLGNIKLLLQYGAEVDVRNDAGETPFLLAAEIGNLDLLKLFRDRGADVRIIDSQGCNALLRTIKTCDVSTEVVRFLAFDEEHLNKKTSTGHTSLMLAAEMVNYEILQTLLQLGADVNIVNTQDPKKTEVTALSILLDNVQIFKDSDIKCIEELLKHGAMSSLPKRCLPVFHKIIVLDKRRLVQLFVAHGMSPCNVDLQPISFRMGAFFEMQMLRYSMNAASPLSAALASGNSHIARYLASNWFLTPSDLTVFSQCSRLRDFLESINMQDCIEFLEEFTSQPLSLMKLSFVAASAAIGPPPGRDTRIAQLPIPSVIKDKLLFKKEEAPMDFGIDTVHNRFGFLDVGINIDTHSSDSPSGVFFDFDDPDQFMYDSDSDLRFSGVMYDSDDTFIKDMAESTGEIELTDNRKNESDTKPEESSTAAENTEVPPLTYVDFTPQSLGSTFEGTEPAFADFGSVIEEANQWLQKNPQFSVYKCETIFTKLGQDFTIDNDMSLSHVAFNGKNVFVRVLRLWLIPNVGPSSSSQQIGYITVLPDHSSGDLKTFLNSMVGIATSRQIGDITFPSFDNLSQTMEKLNRHLQSKPIPGHILCMETLTFKCMEANTADKLLPEAASWVEGGGNAKVFLNAFRLYYIIGKPCFEQVGFYDEAPEILQLKEGLDLRIKFATFDQTLKKASGWLKKQSGCRVLNIQSVYVKLDRKHGLGPWLLDSNAPGYCEMPGLTESRYSKVIRVCYIKDQKLNQSSPYSKITMTSRLFIPCRLEGRTFESFSKTIMRVIKWLSKTKLPIFACETVKYQLTNESEGQGFQPERLDSLINSFQGQLYITCIRLYFPCTYEEPQPDPSDPEDLGWWGWACTVS
ncbi:hypothetical protein Btru_069781 [Bulinus truncatus]|nr:hypothetical protein Btru_069781 [Bulinus truncatus]